MHPRLPWGSCDVAAAAGGASPTALPALLGWIAPIYGAAASPGPPLDGIPGHVWLIAVIVLLILGGVALVAYASRGPQGAPRAGVGAMLAVVAIPAALLALYVLLHRVDLRSTSPFPPAPSERRTPTTTSTTVQELRLPMGWNFSSSGEPSYDPAPRLQAWIDPLAADGTTTLWVELRTAPGWEIACPLQPHDGPFGPRPPLGLGDRGLFVLGAQGGSFRQDESRVDFEGGFFEQRGPAQSELGMQTRLTPLGEQVWVYPERAVWRVPLQAQPARGRAAAETDAPFVRGHLSTELFAFRPSQGVWLRGSYQEPFVARPRRTSGDSRAPGDGSPATLAAGSGTPVAGAVADAPTGTSGSSSSGAGSPAPGTPSAAAGATSGTAGNSGAAADWIQQPDAVRNGVLHTTARTPFLAADDPTLTAELNRAVLQRTQEYVAELVGANGPIQLEIPLDYVRQHVWKDTYREQRDFATAGDNMVRLHARLEFDAAVSQYLRQRWEALLSRNRVAFAAGSFGLLLGLLATLYGYLRLDTLTKGYYTGRLKLAALAIVAGLSAAGYSLWTAFQALSLGG